MHKHRLTYPWSTSCLLFLSTGALLAQPTESPIQTLEEVFAEDIEDDVGELVLPQTIEVASVFGPGFTALNLPRAVTVITPALMNTFGISSIEDLSAIGAGTQRYNYYGIAGAPVLRGGQGAVYLNGMMRAFNRNEMPLSIDSAEFINLIKGPAPANYMPTHIGGYADLVPKTPYFDELRGSVTASVGGNDNYKVTGDVGGPFFGPGNIPAAFRVSFTAQLAESYYNRISNDYVSLYSAIKVRPADGWNVFTGAEFFQFNSNENAGWNRLTPQLISSGQYVTGESALILSENDPRFADRRAIPFTFVGSAFRTYNPAFALTITPEQAATLSAGKRAELIDLSVASGSITPAAAVGANFNDLYTGRGTDPFAGQTLGRDAVYVSYAVDNAGVVTAASPVVGGAFGIANANLIGPDRVQQALVYTPLYLVGADGIVGTADDGRVFTTFIEGDQVLADESDFADSKNFVWFMDVVNNVNPDVTLEWKNLIDWLETRKLSSYGYSVYADQFLINTRLSAIFGADIAGLEHTLTSGVEYKFNYAKILQDFWTEPFPRRDISQDTISANSRIEAGPQGQTFWDGGFGGTGGNGRQSDVHILSSFAISDLQPTDWFRWVNQVRFDHIYASVGNAKDFETLYGINSATNPANYVKQSNSYMNVASNPVFTIFKDEDVGTVNLYGNFYYGFSYQPDQVGTVQVTPDNNYNRAETYEIGLKASLLEDTLFVTAAGYLWEQSRNIRAGNTGATQTVGLEGKGFELEAIYQPKFAEGLTVIASFGAQTVTQKEAPGFRVAPFELQDPGFGSLIADGNITREELARGQGSAQRGAAASGGLYSATSGTNILVDTFNPDYVVPGTPETEVKVTAIYQFPFGLGASMGAVWSDAYYANWERTVRYDSTVVVNARVFYKYGDAWEASISIDNVFEQDHFYAADPFFAAGTQSTKAPGREWEMKFSYFF